MKQQMYSTPKYHITADIEANSREDAIAQFTKLINESPYEHKIKVGVWLLCAEETYRSGYYDDQGQPVFFYQSKPPSPRDHKNSSHTPSPSSDNLPANHNEGTSHHE